eukprot:265478_1
MDALEQFLANHADEVVEQETIETDNESTKDITFADKLGCNKDWKALKASKRFDRSLENRYYNSMTNNNNNPSVDNDQNPLSHRIESYKYKKSTHQVGGAPLETKIHKTPLSYKAKYRNNNNDEPKFESRDPRFSTNPSRDARGHESGWKLRNAYKFLDEMIDRDIDIIKKQIKTNKKEIKDTKKNSTDYSKHTDLEIRKKGVAIDTLKKELIALQNRRDRIQEKDLEQQSKSQMRKMEIDQVKKGIKTPYHHNLKRTRFGQVKFAKRTDASDTNESKPRVSIQNVYLQNKFDRLKQDGKLERYMKKKTKRVNSKFRA